MAKSGIQNTSRSSLSARKEFLRKARRDKYLLILVFPAILYFIVFHYVPMYGLLVAFKRFNMGLGILRSPWAGLTYFKQFFNSYYFPRLVRNTILLSSYNLIFSFTIPIFFALLLNEVRHNKFKRFAQTASYLPHFVSLVVVVGIMMNMFNGENGLINIALEKLGFNKIPFFSRATYFRPLYVGSELWQHVGWNSIIYLAAISGIDPQIYEAAKVDGIGRWTAMYHITFKSILPTIIIIFILNVGNIMNLGFEKIILMYNPATYETADVLSTYVYRRGIVNAEYSFGAVVGLFNSVINLVLLLTVNTITKKLGDMSLF